MCDACIILYACKPCRMAHAFTCAGILSTCPFLRDFAALVTATCISMFRQLIMAIPCHYKVDSAMCMCVFYVCVCVLG